MSTPAINSGAAQRVAPLLFAVLFTIACAGGPESPGAGEGPAPGATTGNSGVPGSERDGSPSWSPDGSEIAFYSERHGDAEIYVMNAAGSDVLRLTVDPANEGYPAFSPDGRRISFDSDHDAAFEIYTMNADGTDVRRLTYNPANDVSAAWSPDGSQIAWMSNRSGPFEVWVMNADGSNQRQFTGAEAPSEGTHWFPQWSPDGERMAFHVNRDVYTVRTDGSEYTRLTVDPDNGMLPSWTPDGSRIVFMSWRTGATEIYSMNADGSDQVRFTHTEVGESVDPRVSPDGRRIVYTWVPAGGAGPKHLMLMNADGTNVRQLTGTAR